ncbi:hypothetical protein BO94DRAFT_555285 [Aspergillus sclerotioniger CBS 115572]|uniref:Uncharacterized protein n=1 Tax=Aspergillus sclerotioniger CBS 115572 TaxID=1450535 RepID=A0A317WZI9_9EURO|nr:hypothetical protein BO94DRAFT_555285 [Aspergillus sclerotioniger CBS 115572]PWY91445.1 hypothetical protein BO94DRAFT_555285 [Aspergillus sclerotioniger CBS 115572]
MPELVRPSLSPLEDRSPPRVHPPGSARSATIAEGTTNLRNQRRNSTLSDSVSEARNSIRSSTDDILFPRAAKRSDANLTNEESHWHSAPLGLALLPAVAGIFFQNGSAVVTDVTLLILAAIFLNWSVRLPWDWYRSAQAVRHADRFLDATDLPLGSEADGRASSQEPPDNAAGNDDQTPSDNAAAVAASRELQIHELVALASCFIFPLIGTWLLHTIRSKLSRPSEGLVSNYNLTIFLLASEIRPFSHLLRMVQGRTLHLQRIVTLSSEDEERKIDVLDLAKRLEELEAHISEAAAARLSAKSPNRAQHSAQDPEVVQLTVTQATAEVRKTFQVDIDALNRAIRRYEKRTAVSAYQTDSRLQALESQIHDAVSLAAAAHRTSTRHPRNLLLTLVSWVYAAFLLPMQLFISFASLPMHVSISCFRYFKDMLFSIYSPSPRPAKDKTPLNKSRSPKRSRRVSSQQDAVDRRPLDPIEETK